jgi:predicted ATP-binding protein involved in virulence
MPGLFAFVMRFCTQTNCSRKIGAPFYQRKYRMNQADSPLRIKSIKVTRLFGLYDHEVTLNPERVTVMHGPNGVGKTVFLKLIDAFLNGRYYEISKVPFESFEIRFADNSAAQIHIGEDLANSRQMHLRFEFPDGRAETTTLEGRILDTQRLATQVAAATPYFSRIGPDEWVDKRTNSIVNSDEMITLAIEKDSNVAKRWTIREQTGWREVRSRITVHLIEAQRLIRLPIFSANGRSRPTTNTVQEYSLDLKHKLENTLANYAKQSQKLDQTFPQRLLQQTIVPLTISELKRKMQQVEQTRARLKKIGILDSGDSSSEANPLQIAQLDDLQPEQVSVLSVYAGDTEEKLAVLEELAGPVEILLDVLNRKFINKKVIISREAGLAIFDKDDKEIPVTALSSGEQHELVLLYDLLFKVKPNTLVLIDEPELSLHISWQKNFMDDLLEIIKLAQFDVLMATHSPYIVGDHSDLLVELSSEPVI